MQGKSMGLLIFLYLFAACKRDIIIVIDRSAPMFPFRNQIKAFLIDLISHLDIGADQTLIAMGTFAHLGTIQWNLDR